MSAFASPRWNVRPMHYRRDGTPYRGPGAVLRWARDHAIHGNRCVDESWTPYGERLSTVWLGLDMGFFGEPLIFETMMFGQNGAPGMQERYATETEARIGHERVYYQLLVPPPLRRWTIRGWV